MPSGRPKGSRNKRAEVVLPRENMKETGIHKIVRKEHRKVFGHNMKKMRKLLGYSANSLVEMGIFSTIQTVYSIESGRQSPTMEQIHRLVALGVPYEDYFRPIPDTTTQSTRNAFEQSSEFKEMQEALHNYHIPEPYATNIIWRIFYAARDAITDATKP